MTNQTILQRLQSVFDQTFVEKHAIHPETKAQDIPEWDSLTHVSLILAVEQEFHIRFRTGEVEWTRNIGDLTALITKRVKQ